MPTIWDQPFTQAAPAQAQPQPGTSNLFYNPTSNYGGTDRNWNTTPLAGQIRENNPSLAYAQYGQNQGIADNDNTFNRWFYQQFPRFQTAYGQATLQNPFIRIDDFLKTLPGMQQLQAQFQQLSPQSRGLNFGANAPVVRTIAR